MNRIKWIVFLVIALATPQGKAQGVQGGPPQGPNPNPPNLPPQIDPEIIRRIEIPKFDPGPFPRHLGENYVPKNHEWKWPDWVCWQSALGLFAFCFVIGFFYGRFDPMD